MKVNHDIHLHSFLSSCCSDERMTPNTILEHAVRKGYDTVCITDHCWDSAVPGASDWYAPQSVEHILGGPALPESKDVRMLRGCETEYCGGKKLGLSRAGFDRMAFVAIPINHFHMKNFVCSEEIVSPRDIALLQMERLEQLLALDLPWQKIGIAHFTCPLARRGENLTEVIREMPDDRLLRIFRLFAQRGTGIELNATCFPAAEDFDEMLRPYRIALDAGCKVYYSSDAHRVENLEIDALLAPVIRALRLTPQQLYRIP